MKRVFLLIVVSALLVMLGFAQTPGAGSNTDQANIKGGLGGSDGNYTVAEDSTRQIFKITTSSVDLKPHVGHAVNLIGHKPNEEVSSGPPNKSFAVTELTMISEHCVGAAAAPVATVTSSSDSVVAPAADAAAPNATVSTPAVDPAPPIEAVSPSSATVSVPAASSAPVSTPAVGVSAPAPEASPSSATVSAPARNAAHAPRPSAHSGRLSATQAAAATAPAVTASPSSEPVTPPPLDTATPAATASSSAEAVSTPAAAANTPTVTHGGGSLWLLIAFVVLVIVLGTLAPLIGRWRKRRILEQTRDQNLSFTNETSSDQEKSEPRKVA